MKAAVAARQDSGLVQDFTVEPVGACGASLSPGTGRSTGKTGLDGPCVREIRSEAGWRRGRRAV